MCNFASTDCSLKARPEFHDSFLFFLPIFHWTMASCFSALTSWACILTSGSKNTRWQSFFLYEYLAIHILNYFNVVGEIFSHMRSFCLFFQTHFFPIFLRIFYTAMGNFVTSSVFNRIIHFWHLNNVICYLSWRHRVFLNCLEVYHRRNHIIMGATFFLSTYCSLNYSIEKSSYSVIALETVM